jgi:hypothetical protein
MFALSLVEELATRMHASFNAVRHTTLAIREVAAMHPRGMGIFLVAIVALASNVTRK